MSGEEGRVVWTVSRKETFSMQPCNAILETGSSTSFLGVIWNSWAPSKASLFAWEACW